MRSIVALCIAVLLMACGGSNLPDGVLPADKFGDVMWDLTRTAEFLNGFKTYKDSSDQKAADQLMYQNKVFTLHKVTREQFDRSYAYYRERPKLMQVILDSISKKPQAPRTDTGEKKDVVSVDSSLKKVTPVVNVDSNRGRGK